jgi:hypothetical protein
MRSIKITGLCLVAVFAMSMAAAAAASAEPVWEQCSTEKVAEHTKWTNSECNVASSTGAWNWKEVENTEKIYSTAALKLTDTKVPLLGEAEVECLGTDEGVIGPGRYDRIQTVRVASCKPVKVCENVETVVPKNLPWQTELYETGKEVRDKITEGTTKLQPGWSITCKAPVVGSVTDVCETESGKEVSTSMRNIQESGIVQAEFETKSGKTQCTQGGAAAGRLWGILRIAAQVVLAIESLKK